MISATERVRVIFGLKLKQLRQDKGFQLYELADRAGLSPSYLNEIEKGKKYPKSEKIFALAAALGTDYDTLVSVKLSKQLEPIAELLNSNILSELPLNLFGIEPADLLDILSQAPSRVSAFISTIIEISRNYGMNVEQFYFSALRSYQELHNNYFEDIETVAADFIRNHAGNEPLTEPPFDEGRLRRILEEEFSYRIDEFSEVDYPALAGIRSLVLPGSPTVLLINRSLEPSQRAFTYGREVGFRVMQLTNRPLISSQTEAESFEQVLNNYKATYFAVAILVPRPLLITGLASFFARPTWEPQALLDLMNRFDATPEVFMHRISNVMPSHFGIDQLFFLRFDNAVTDNRFVLAKELHLAKLHNPHGTINEHYCHRWVSLTLLQDLARQQQAGSWDGQPLCGGQISEYMDTSNRYLILTVAKPSPPRAGLNSSVTLGFAIDDRLRALVRFLDDPQLVRRAVNETCERCGALDCLERAAPPVVWKKRRRNEQIKQELAMLRAGLPAKD
ncbi:XRE family transcriptional regulator [Fibrisoma montanum]|uniref:XRE family transcriptional regulator n=1 Tax=Fibrisoma montanum TaxID=2305895 RepID=A0A418MBX2_9BACT|nr:helix-turn-helix transcriptional regulator [Fibrisoma montanum]RIV23867.1 XRE family transcriptional regulator [Fibrisoma montanum]